MISNKILQLAPSATVEMDRIVKELQKEGREVISFGIGEPNFDVPENAKEAARRAIDENFSRYTASDGILELREAIADKLKRENNIEYGAENIIAGAGAKQCLYNVFQALLNPGDEVVLASPYWVSYPAQIELAGGAPIIVEIKKDFILRESDLRAKISPRTKALVLNSPNNPTGAVIPKEELQKIAELAVEKNIIMISDEVYEYFVYRGGHISIASLSEEIKARTLTINAMSKSFGMTGWRLGYAAGPKEIISAMKKLQNQSTSNPSGLSQKAAIAALRLGKEWASGLVEEFKKKRDFVCNELKSAGVDLMAPAGAFYVFFNISDISGKKSVDFCKNLLERAGIALVPGIAFGNDECARLSYATNWEDLKKGMKRFKMYLSSRN